MFLGHMCLCAQATWSKFPRKHNTIPQDRRQSPPPPGTPPTPPIMCLPRSPPPPVHLPHSLRSLKTRTNTPSLLASLAQETCTCARVNAVGILFWGKEGLRPASQMLALRVYNMPTMSTISRPRLRMADRVYRLQTTFTCAWVNAVSFGPLPRYWHFMSTTCRQCPQSADYVYLGQTASRLFTAFSCARVNTPPPGTLSPLPTLGGRGGDFVPYMSHNHILMHDFRMRS